MKAKKETGWCRAISDVVLEYTRTAPRTDGGRAVLCVWRWPDRRKEGWSGSAEIFSRRGALTKSVTLHLRGGDVQVKEEIENLAGVEQMPLPTQDTTNGGTPC